MWPFSSKPKEKKVRQVDVRRGIAKVTVNDGREFELEFVGDWLGIHPLGRGEDWVYDASQRFVDWQERGQKRGMVAVGDGLHIPLCNITDVKVSYEEHLVEVPA